MRDIHLTAFIFGSIPFLRDSPGLAVPDARWQAGRARMVQVSRVGYGTAGAFLTLAHFDLLFNLSAVVVPNRVSRTRRLAGESEDNPMETTSRKTPAYDELRPGTASAAQAGPARRY